MKILKKIIIIKLILLFSLIGCTDETRTWSLVIVNKLTYPICVEVTLSSEARHSPSSGQRKFELLIEPEKIDFISNFHMHPRTESKAHKGVREILVFSEDKTIPLMILRGKAMDEYVVRVGSYHNNDGWQFCLEVNEENIGVGLNKGMYFEEDVEDEIEEHEDNQDDIEENISIDLSENI